MAGDPITAGLSLADTIAKWATDPTGYQQFTIERKLDSLHEAAIHAVAHKDWASADALIAEYKRMQQELT